MKQEQKREPLTGIQEITVFNVQTAAGLSELPEDLSPEIRKAAEVLRSGKRLTKRQIVEIVDEEVELNSRLY